MCYITLALGSIAITFRLTNLSNSIEFCYSSHLTVALLSKKVTASNKTRISVTVLTQARSIISFWQFSHFHRPQRPLGRVEVQLYSIFDIGSRRGCGVSVAPRPHLTPGKGPLPILQEAEWSSWPVWTGAENLAPTWIRSRTTVAIPTTLPGP